MHLAAAAFLAEGANEGSMVERILKYVVPVGVAYFVNELREHLFPRAQRQRAQ
jgi:hypothetical protein